ncbi:hypothetical protein AAFF_G00274820 [Aldrovandia affinis]|uniref:Uncharacterized protein n=1 Tax=Aldrovandia affinis TaxID=143900 RepID=A0AAD7WSQ6_9TELE|nr:hypothetical protein AAFF_G00274820 [Aldrovandia affinis]
MSWRMLSKCLTFRGHRAPSYRVASGSFISSPFPQSFAEDSISSRRPSIVSCLLFIFIFYPLLRRPPSPNPYRGLEEIDTTQIKWIPGPGVFFKRATIPEPGRVVKSFPRKAEKKWNPAVKWKKKPGFLGTSPSRRESPDASLSPLPVAEREGPALHV